MAAKKSPFIYDNSKNYRANCSEARKWLKSWMNIDERAPSKFGPLYWACLHIISSKLPEDLNRDPIVNKEDQDSAVNFITTFNGSIPCGECRQHYASIVSQIHDPASAFIASGRTQFFYMTYMLHNYVTQKVHEGRAFPKFTYICERYGVNPENLLPNSKKMLKDIGLY